MYYDLQPIEKQEKYKNMLKIVGSLSRLFSESDTPYLYYRAHENIFSKYFEMSNNARSDDSADSFSSDGIGVGLKTWVGQDNQKVAEFGRLRPEYETLKGIELVKKIAEYRNERIRVTMNAHGLHEMLYHIVKRIPGAMQIWESAFDKIDIDNIKLIRNRGNENSIYFNDGNHTYHFSLSKNTLYMNFDEMEKLDEFEVEIVDDPFELLENLVMHYKVVEEAVSTPQHEQLCLRLYSVKKDGKKFVAEKSGLNQWNGARTQYKIDETTHVKTLVKTIPRNPNELYIPYPAVDRNRNPDFFPPRDTPFALILPDGQVISAKVCQDDSKAIMSNPNSVLGKWLLRDVFELPEGIPVTYEMLKSFGIDSVIFTKLENGYSIDFSKLGTYEKMYGLEDNYAIYDNEED